MDKNIKLRPLITVLMPVYNCELYVSEAIESILNQTFDDFEFLIIDDASTDKTVSIIKSFEDPRIHLIEKPINVGYTDSLNLGLKIANGKYIARMDGDDISLPERFAKQIAFLETHPEVVLCGAWLNIIDSNRIVKLPENHTSIKLALLKGNCIVHPTIMMRKQTLDEFSIRYELSKEPAEDYALWVKLLRLGRLHNLQEVLLYYRKHGAQVSSKRANEQQKSALYTRIQLLKYLECNMTLKETETLNKVFSEDSNISFNEIEIFQSIIGKLLVSNSSEFFEPNGFKIYLFNIENRLIKRYFFNRDTYPISNFIHYLKIKNKLGLKISTKKEIKLFAKSIFPYKLMNS
ncbi:MAG: glycosyltransferase [Flaviramulus sp.]|nr:glycosyltransferase [Flaviramulus sp.]NNC50945.1 glycosyltransferase [Flaviramulus sp.]